MSFWDKAGTALNAVAPALGGLVAGPVGAGAVMAVQRIFGLKDGSTDTEVAAAIASATPEQIAQLRKLDYDFQVSMATIDFQFVTAAANDRDSARRRESEVKDCTNRNLAYGIIAAFIAMAGCILAGAFQVDSTLAGTLIGIMAAKAEQVLAYYFGSTASGRVKDNTINKLSS